MKKYCPLMSNLSGEPPVRIECTENCAWNTGTEELKAGGIEGICVMGSIAESLSEIASDSIFDGASTIGDALNDISTTIYKK